MAERPVRVRDRGVLLVLLGSMLASAALLLWLGRTGTLYSDEVRIFGASTQVDFPEWIEPWNGHLQLTSRVLYKALFETFGANYFAVRVQNVLMILVTAGVFFALVRRRIGAVAALAPTLLLLFLGSAWTILLGGFGIVATFTIATGLGALLALERDDTRGNVAACVLITLSVASFSAGLAFLAGVIVAVLLRPTRWRDAWIFLIPLTLYAAWWIWARQFNDDQTTGANALLVPFWILESLAVDAGSLLGVNLQLRLRIPPSLETTTWARAAAIAFLIALAVRVRQGGLPRSFWVSVTIALVYWALIGLVGTANPARVPASPRYIYPGAVVLLLVATDALRGIALSSRAIAVLFGVTAFGLIGNVALLRAGGEFFRGYSNQIGTDLKMIEVARASVPHDLVPALARVDDQVLIDAGTYLRAVQRFGSPARTLAEVRKQPAWIRESADTELGRIYRPALSTAPRRGTRCERIAAAAGQPVRFALPAGSTVTMRTAAGPPAAVALRRFGERFTVAAGSLTPKTTAALSLPADAAPDPWQAEVQAPALTVCREP
jgi:hypothetical protein